MAEPSPKRLKADDDFAKDPYVSFFFGKAAEQKEVNDEKSKKETESTSLSVEKDLNVLPVDDGVVEIIDPTIPAGFGMVDGVLVKLVEPKEEVVDELEAAEGENRDEIGQALQGVLETADVTLKGLLDKTMSDTSVAEKVDRTPACCEKEVYEIDDSEEEEEKEDADGPTLNKKLYTPKFITYSIKCNLCSVFSNHPLAHIWYHFAEQPRFQCAYCNMAAGLVEDVAAHMKSAHKSVLVRPIDRINGLREALWSFNAHKCFPKNFKRELEPENQGISCDLTECICGAIIYKEDPVLFNHIILAHADDDLNYDDPEGTKHRFFFDLDGSIRKRMRAMEKVNIESAKCETLRVRKGKSTSVRVEKRMREEESDNEDQELDSEESEEEEEELEEGEVEEEEEDESDGLE